MNNYEKAIAELKTATNVEEWNAIRAKWAQKLEASELSTIDGSGLIVEVLGADPTPSY